VPLIRGTVTAAAADAGATPGQIDAARLAVTEAATNVVLHAYDATAGSIHVRVGVIDGELQIVIDDDGFGIRPRTDSPGIGAGLSIIARSCESLEVGSGASGGGRMRMRFALTSKPAAAGSPPDALTAQAPAPRDCRRAHVGNTSSS